MDVNKPVGGEDNKISDSSNDGRRVAILGGGSFGTTIANMVAANGYRATMWVRDKQLADSIQRDRQNQRYLPGYALHDNLTATAELSSAVADSEFIFICIPSSSFREVVRHASPFIDSQSIVVSTTKGIEKPDFKLMSQVLQEEIPHVSAAVISGPNIAKEIAAHQLTATVVAAGDSATTHAVQQVLHTKYFRVYSNNDVYGVELGGALKNVYAIMAGMGAALDVGKNTLSMLMTRSLAEMGRFAQALGANPATFLGLAGVGDLIVTCLSPHSRNYQVGYELGKGVTLEQALADLAQVAEGVSTLEQVKVKADEMNVYMPLVNGLYNIIYQGGSLDAVISELMMGEHNTDVDFSIQT